MLGRVLTTGNTSSQSLTNGAHPSSSQSQAAEQPTLGSTLALLTEAVAAFAAATDLNSLASAAARRLARAAGADQATVWLLDSADGERLVAAAAWPERPAFPTPPPLALADAPCARETLEHSAARQTHCGMDPAALGLNVAVRRDMPLWAVPLTAGGRHWGVAYVAVPRATTPPDDLGRLLSLLGAQAALAGHALRAPQAVRREGAEFLAVAAHDMKNVATSIKGYTQLLRRNLPIDAPSRAQRWTDIVEQQVGALTEILSALVDLGRLECGRYSLVRGAADLREVVEAVATRLPADDGALPVRLQLPTEPVRGDWDAARLARALTAAVDSARRTSTADVEALTITVLADAAEARVLLSAVLPGEGWPAHGEWSAGADVALYLLRGIVQAHGGEVSYRRTEEGLPLIGVGLPLS